MLRSKTKTKINNNKDKPKKIFSYRECTLHFFFTKNIFIHGSKTKLNTFFHVNCSFPKIPNCFRSTKTLFFLLLNIKRDPVNCKHKRFFLASPSILLSGRFCSFTWYQNSSVLQTIIIFKGRGNNNELEHRKFTISQY